MGKCRITWFPNDSTRFKDRYEWDGCTNIVRRHDRCYRFTTGDGVVIDAEGGSFLIVSEED